MNKLLIVFFLVTLQIHCSSNNSVNQGKLKYLRTVYSLNNKKVNVDTLRIVFDTNHIFWLFEIPKEATENDTLLESVAYSAKLNSAIIKLSTDISPRVYDYTYYSDTLLSVSHIADTVLSGNSNSGILLTYQRKQIKVYFAKETFPYMPFMKFKNSMYIDIMLFSKSVPKLFIIETAEDISFFNLIKSDFNKLDVDLSELFQ